MSHTIDLNDQSLTQTRIREKVIDFLCEMTAFLEDPNTIDRLPIDIHADFYLQLSFIAGMWRLRETPVLTQDALIIRKLLALEGQAEDACSRYPCEPAYDQ